MQKGDRAASACQMMENFRFFGAPPHMALITAPPKELGQYAYLDCGGFITGFCLAARSLGLGSIPQAAVAGFSPPCCATGSTCLRTAPSSSASLSAIRTKNTRPMRFALAGGSDGMGDLGRLSKLSEGLSRVSVSWY